LKPVLTCDACAEGYEPETNGDGKIKSCKKSDLFPNCKLMILNKTSTGFNSVCALCNPGFVNYVASSSTD
jgi:hypothetical protein